MKRAYGTVLVSLLLAAAPAACGGDDTTSTGGTGGTGGSGGTGAQGGSGAQGGGGEMNVAPAPPTDLALSLSSTPYGVDATWTPPADTDLAGYLVARHDAPFDDSNAPVDAQTYAAGDTLPGGASVVFVGDMTSALDPDAPLEATSHYAVFALDDGGLYSEPATDSIDISFPPQTGSIEVGDIMGGPTVTVLEQPPHADLSGTATYNGATGELTLSLTVTNLADRIIFSPKVAVDAVPNGATASSDGSTVDGRPCAYYGPAGLAVGASQTRDIVIGGFGNTDPVVIDVEVLNNPMGFSNTAYNKGLTNFFDVSGAVDASGNALGGQQSYQLGWKAGTPIDGRITAGSFAPDGTFLYTGWKSRPIVSQIDMSTLEVVTSADLSQDTSNYGVTTNVVMSPDGASLYTVVTTGAHRYSGGPNYAGSSSVDLVRLDRATLAEQDRINLITNAPLQANGRPALGNYLASSADGSTLAVSVMPGQIWLVDTAGFTIIDADPGTAGDQAVDVGGVSPLVRLATFSPSGAEVYVGYSEDQDLLTVIDLATFGTSTMTSTSTSGANGAGWSTLAFGPDGDLYIARNFLGVATDIGFSIFDPAQSSYDDVGVGLQVLGLLFDPRGERYYVLQRDLDAVNNNGEILTYDLATHTLVDIDGDGANGQTNLPAADVSSTSSHAQGITPF